MVYAERMMKNNKDLTLEKVNEVFADSQHRLEYISRMKRLITVVLIYPSVQHPKEIDGLITQRELFLMLSTHPIIRNN